MRDIVIIGAGVIGCAIARELSRYDLDICVVEKESDVCEGTSKANSAIVHGGFDAHPGTLKAKMNVLGTSMMEEMAKILDFEFVRNGSMVVCHSEEEFKELERLQSWGVQNGVKGMMILDRNQALAMEPHLADSVYAVLYIPSSGIVCPFGMTIAYAENAFTNGVEFLFSTEVKEILKLEDGYQLLTNKGSVETRHVINAAGVYADSIHNMVSEKKIHITPRRGQYCLLDKSEGDFVKHTIFQLPSEKGKGILVTPTVHGNLLLGPTAEDMEDKEATMTTAEGLQNVIQTSAKSVKNIAYRQVITSFSGLRAHEEGGDFIIGEVEDAAGFFDVAGIESPGLSSAPAIGVYVRDLIGDRLHPVLKDNFIERRIGIQRFADQTKEKQAQMIQENPSYGKVVCRCEKVTEGEILDAIHRPLGAKTLDGIKRRTRAGMGRCQAGFCMPKTMELLAQELGVELKDIRKTGAEK